MNRILEKIKGDRAIWMVVIFLSIFSLLAVYSSTGTLAYRFRAGNTGYYIIKHFIIMLLGLGLMVLASRVKYTYYSRISQLALWIAAPLLLLTLVRGTNINEANRWLTLPIINISFQSSDFAKLALIMFVSRILTKKQETIKDFKDAFVPVLVPILIITGLILPANLSTAGILFLTCVILMFIGGVNIKYLLAFGGIGLAGLALFILIATKMPEGSRVSTWSNRIETFVGKPGDNYQTEQAKIAIATGGVFGKMPGNSTQRNFLPHAYSDFIYAIIIEEYGLIGGFIVLILYLILFYRGIRIARESPGTFGALLAAGLSFSLVFQAMINMAVAVDLFPVTGQPLPLISMGGTSLWFSSLAIGIILSVSRKIEENELNGKAIVTS
ncbi:MAG: FtsW/RodA/SpoVE family cell cycle protein [Bacteroides sp.]|jgi:cell division protein FtsW|nr:FtsW/RodA/SpoVE family cell cycle protein [Bacteroides sp.]